MPKVFISYKRDHEASERVVREIEKALGNEFELLRDQNIQPGDRWLNELDDWLMTCDAGIAIVSNEANTADWCRREWAVLATRSVASKLPVIPIHIEAEIIQTNILDDIQALKWTPDVASNLRERLVRLPLRASSPKDFLAAHQAWLRWQFKESQVMGQEPFALADVYIDTECGQCSWGELEDDKDGQRLDPFKEANGGRSDLVRAVLDRFADRDFRDMIVVQGGPGCGKSAFTLRIANELMTHGFTPIYVRFRDLRLSRFPDDVAAAIDDAIRIGSTDEDSPHSESPIVASLMGDSHCFKGTPQCRTVFILDGWDEVSLTGNVVFQTQLRRWLPKLRQHFVSLRTPRIRLLLTGRPSMEVDHSGVMQKHTPVLTIRPIRPEQLRSYATAVKARLTEAGRNHRPITWSIDMKKLEPILSAYSKWFQQYVTGQSLTLTSSAEVLSNPLLAYLSLRVIAQSNKPPDELLREPTALYSELIDTTVQYSGKGQDVRLEETVHRGGKKLRRLLHEVAATISILRRESTSYKELKFRFESSELPVRRELLKDWTRTTGTENALQELVINFYFKGGRTMFGCEFLHKSFREYLFAEAVFFALDDTATEQYVAHDVLEYWQEFRQGTPAFLASRRLAYLLAPQWLSQEVEQHLIWLLKRATRKDPERWGWIRDLVTEVYAWWAEGVHLRHQPNPNQGESYWSAPFVDKLFGWTAPLDSDVNVRPIRTNVLDAHLGDALMRLAAILHVELPHGVPAAEGRRSDYQSLHDGKLRFRPGGSGFFRAALARLDAEGWRRSAGLGDLCLAGVDLSCENLESIGGHKCQLEFAFLVNVNLVQCELSLANLSGANLNGANLNGAALNGADLHSANLNGANLNGAVLRYAGLGSADLSLVDSNGADLSHANLNGATLNSANLTNANLSEANLIRASLNHTNLIRTSLGGVDLHEADLRGANLNGANLNGANLNGANLTHANLSHANLNGANLNDADLTHADLTHADLTHANLRDTDFTGANLRDTKVFEQSAGTAKHWDLIKGTPFYVK